MLQQVYNVSKLLFCYPWYSMINDDYFYKTLDTRYITHLKAKSYFLSLFHHFNRWINITQLFEFSFSFFCILTYPEQQLRLSIFLYFVLYFAKNSIHNSNERWIYYESCDISSKRQSFSALTHPLPPIY